MTLFIVIASLGLLVLLITYWKVNSFIAFLLVSIFAGVCFGLPLPDIAKSIQKGLGDTLGSLVVILVLGAMLGKLVASSGAAKQISGVCPLTNSRDRPYTLTASKQISGV